MLNTLDLHPTPCGTPFRRCNSTHFQHRLACVSDSHLSLFPHRTPLLTQQHFQLFYALSLGSKDQDSNENHPPKVLVGWNFESKQKDQGSKSLGQGHIPPSTTQPHTKKKSHPFVVKNKSREINGIGNGSCMRRRTKLTSRGHSKHG